MSLPLSALDARVLLKGYLGEGGMGQVHRAWDQILERAVAVKFLRGTDPREAERLLLEARLQARVDHPHVVKVHEVGTLEGRPCIVLQLVEGRSLADLAATLPLDAKVEVLRQAAEGLHAAHRQGLLHRDIKPANVLVEETPEGRRAMVSDFGLARDQEGELTRSGLPSGTLDFMSPEQLLGRGPLDFRSDVYALGATLYSVLAGRHPFRDSPRATAAGLATPASSTGMEEPSQLLRRILEDAPPPLKGLVPGLPAELPLIVAKAMEKDPALRYATAEAFAEDLGRFQRGEAILARRTPLVERLLRWSRHNWLAARALAVAGVAVLVGSGAALWTLRRSERAALEAATLASEAQELHQRMTVEKLLPMHALHSARTEVRAVLNRATALGKGRKSGPAAFLAGRAHQLLGEDAAALEALSRAWELGYRLPEVAYALAVAEGERFRVERANAKAVEDPKLAAQQVHEAERRWRDPARARFALLPGRGDALGRLAQVRIALLEERYVEAQAQARVLAGENPALIEALELGLTAQAGLVTEALQRGDLPVGMQLAEAALRDGEAALATARSSMELRLILVQLHLRFLPMKLAPGRTERHLDLADRRAEEALQLDPESARALRVASEVATHRAAQLRDQGKSFTEALERGLALAERATRASPADVEAWEQLAFQALNAASLLKGGLHDVNRPLELGLAAARKARSLQVGPPRTLHEAQGLLLRATLAQERGEPSSADVEQALQLAEEALAAGLHPLGGRLVKAKALQARANAAALSGGDPFPDFRASWAVLQQTRESYPQGAEAGGWSLDLLNDWTYQATIEGRVDVPLEEGEALGRASVAANPSNQVARVVLGGLRMNRGLFALRQGQRAQGEAWYREGEAQVRILLGSPIGPAVRQGLADWALERAWITRVAPDVAAAEARIRDHLRVSPGDPAGRRFLASVLLLRAELAPEARRGALLDQATRALEAATAAGMSGLPVLALRGRLKERIKPGSGAEDLAEARRINPRLYLLRDL